jgi:hypothetical protein
MNRLKTLTLAFFIVYLIVAFHTPYFHLHIQPGHTHSSNHDHYSEPEQSKSVDHTHKSKTTLSKTDTIEADHQNVIRHLHFTRELYKPRKNPQLKSNSYKGYTFNTISPVPKYNHTLLSTLNDFHIIKYSPESSKTFSGLSPPVS